MNADLDNSARAVTWHDWLPVVVHALIAGSGGLLYVASGGSGTPDANIAGGLAMSFAYFCGLPLSYLVGRGDNYHDGWDTLAYTGCAFINVGVHLVVQILLWRTRRNAAG